MRHIDSADGARVIAAEILAARTRPFVLISTLPDGSFAFDADKVAHDLDHDAEVVTITTGEATYALEERLPPKSHVFNGAARSYPPDFGADPDWQRSILRFPERDAEDLIEDALAQMVLRLTEAPVRRTWVCATVERISGTSTGNVARLADGQQVIIVADGLPSSLTLADGLDEGGRVEGWLTGKDFAPVPEPVDLVRFTEGVVTLARVTKVTELRAKLTLHPLAPEVDLRRRAVIPGVDDGDNEDVKVNDVLRVGETVRVRVVSEKAGIGLTLIDVGEERPFVPPLSILRGGPPWLRDGVHAAEPAAATASAHGGEPTPVAASPNPETSSPTEAPVGEPAWTRELAHIRDELAGLKDAFVRLGREVRAGTELETLDQLRDENSSLSEELRRVRAIQRDHKALATRLRQELRDARSLVTPAQLSGTRTDRSAWPDEESWFRHEVIGTWAARTGASDKQQYPLAPFVIGAGFLDSVREIGDRYTDKVLRGVVDALTGRAAEIPARQLHRLREGPGGSDPYVTRHDGALCWRLSLEIGAASARRLHYWQVPGGTIELSRVVLHDDIEP